MLFYFTTKDTKFFIISLRALRGRWCGIRAGRHCRRWVGINQIRYIA